MNQSSIDKMYGNSNIIPQISGRYSKGVREKLKLKPRQKLQIINIGDTIEFVPIRDIKSARGFLKGIDTNINREGDGE